MSQPQPNLNQQEPVGSSSASNYSEQPKLNKLEGDIQKLAQAVIEVSKTANAAVQQIGQIGQVLNQLIPAVQSMSTGQVNGQDNGNGAGMAQGQSLTQEQIDEMMANGQIPPNQNMGNPGAPGGLAGGITPGQINQMKGAGSNLIEKILQAIPLLTQLNQTRSQPDPKAVLMHNFTESLDLIKAVIGMTDQLKKAVTTDLGMVEKATQVGEKVKKAVNS